MWKYLFIAIGVFIATSCTPIVESYTQLPGDGPGAPFGTDSLGADAPDGGTDDGNAPSSTDID